MIKCKYWSGKDVESKVSSVYDEENRLVNMNDVEYDDEVPEDLDEIEELMVEALGLEDGPKLESEIDLMEWFAEMDEDDWSDLTEYTSETDDDTGCGSAGYDGRDGPRERGEEELMSPPMQPNGGGSDDTCALGSYFSYDTCLSYNGGDVEYCDCHCLNLGCDDDDGSNGAECNYNAKWWGYQIVCNQDAVEYLYTEMGIGDMEDELGEYFDVATFLIPLLVGAVNPPVGVIIGETGYFVNKVADCHNSNEMLKIEQTWALTHPVLKCEAS